MTLRAFLARQIEALRERYSVTVIANFGDRKTQPGDPEIHFVPVTIERRISLVRDLRALTRLASIFGQHRFEVVHSITPKAGLLAMAAAWLRGVPVRIHTFTGQVWATHAGPMRLLLRTVDGLIARFATHILVDSRSQREFLVANRVVTLAKSAVLANGSICGVDGDRFRPDGIARRRIRSEARIPEQATLFLYLGRLSRDKGVLDLARAFAPLAQEHASARLMLVGPDEDGLRKSVQEIATSCADRVHWVDYVEEPEAHMAAADVFCLPSYREGFGQVAIEAAAAGLPVVASRIYGVVDAVVDGETGLLHPPGDIEALRAHMDALLLSPDLRRRLGTAGRSRVLLDFSAKGVTRALLDYYAEITRKL